MPTRYPDFTPTYTGKPIQIAKIRKYAQGILVYRRKHGITSMKNAMLEHYLELTSKFEECSQKPTQVNPNTRGVR